ncbi:Calpain-15 [Tyrophagus putrescentiae]|nr:Calpain-15 [Tyrophagus putrescentiae]
MSSSQTYQTRSRSNSYKMAAAIAASAYYWVCPGCENKNSNYSDVCLRCRDPKPNSISSSAFRRNGSTKSYSSPKSSSSSATTTTSPSSAKQTTKQTTKQSVTSSAAGNSGNNNSRIIPMTITTANSSKPTTSASAKIANKQTTVNMRNKDGNNNNSSKITTKPRSVSVHADKFQAFVNNRTTQAQSAANRALSPDRRTLSTYNIGPANAIKAEVAEAVKKCIRTSPTSISSSDRSKTALLLPLLHATGQYHKGKFASRLKSLQKEDKNFEDEAFSKNRSSLYVSTEDSDPAYDRLIDRWLRVEEIRFSGDEGEDSSESSKSLVVLGPSPSVGDFRQGTIGDCWFICSLACLVSALPSYLKLLIPDPELHPREGAYQLFLCLDGRWTPVEVDDYLPVDSGRRLVFSQATGNQLFAPLLEKALAKHHTAYKALSAGTVLEGFSNLTGMPVRRKDILGGGNSTTPADINALWRYIHLHLKVFRYLLSGSCSRDTYGLHANHAYSVLDALSTADGQKALLLWNPWGRQELFGSLSQFNTLISKKYSKDSKLAPGAFWIRFSDFCNNFTALDVAKVNTRWICQRFEFSLPFDLADERRNFTVFSLDVPAGSSGKKGEETHFEFTLYQKVHRDVQFKFRLDLSLVIFRRDYKSEEAPLQYVACSRVFESKVASYGKRLPPGRYLVAVLGFNHWGATSRLRDAPRLVIAFHGSRSYQVTALSADTHLLGDMLIELAVAVGVRKNNDAQHWCQYVVPKNFCSFVLVMENRNEKEHLVAEYSSAGSSHAFSVRSAPRTVDLIPPKSRQVIIILSRECDKNSCLFETSGKNYRNYVPPHLLQGSSYAVDLPHPDVQKMSALFAPRLIASAASSGDDTDKHQHQIRSPAHSPPQEMAAFDEENETTWKAVKGGSGCVIS